MSAAPIAPGAREAAASRRISGPTWLLVDQIVRMALGLTLGIWIARHLGPHDYGLLSFAGSVTSIAIGMAPLGLESIVVRDLVTHEPHEQSAILRTAIALRLLAAALLYGLPIALAFAAGIPGAPAMASVMALAIPIQASAGGEWLLQARGKFGAVTLGRTGGAVAAALLRIGLILGGASVMGFASAYVAETLTAAVLIVFAMRQIPDVRWSPRLDFVIARRLLAQSWPILLSGVAVFVYLKTDQIMLGWMLGPEAVGVYTTALRLAEPWQALWVVIPVALFPALARLQTGAQRLEAMQKQLDVLFVLSACVALPTTLLADTIIGIVFGSQYAAAGPMLAVLAWSPVFAALGAASGRWMVLENLNRHVFSRTLLGALLNVALNILLIPRFGGIGAAWASLAAQVLAAWLFDAFVPATRPMFRVKSRTFFLLAPTLRHSLGARLAGRLS